MHALRLRGFLPIPTPTPGAAPPPCSLSPSRLPGSTLDQLTGQCSRSRGSKSHSPSLCAWPVSLLRSRPARLASSGASLIRGLRHVSGLFKAGPLPRLSLSHFCEHRHRPPGGSDPAWPTLLSLPPRDEPSPAPSLPPAPPVSSLLPRSAPVSPAGLCPARPSSLPRAQPPGRSSGLVGLSPPLGRALCWLRRTLRRDPGSVHGLPSASHPPREPGPLLCAADLASWRVLRARLLLGFACSPVRPQSPVGSQFVSLEMPFLLDPDKDPDKDSTCPASLSSFAPPSTYQAHFLRSYLTFHCLSCS